MSEQKLEIQFWEQCGEKCFLLYTILRWTNKVIPPNPFQTTPARDQTFRYTNLWDHSHSSHHNHWIKDYMWKLYFCLGQAKWMSDTGNCQIVPLIKRGDFFSSSHSCNGPWQMWWWTLLNPEGKDYFLSLREGRTLCHGPGNTWTWVWIKWKQTWNF